jgi:penicillin-binding protein 2
MPEYLPRLQFKTDSIRAYKWFELTQDSNYIKKYLPRHNARKENKLPAPVVVHPAKDLMINKNLYVKRSTTDKIHP